LNLSALLLNKSFRLLIVIFPLFTIAFAAIPLSCEGGDDLPALHTGDIVLFQGDSITDGGRQRTGSDYNHIMGQSYAYILAAMIGALHPGRNLTFINRGIGGNRVSDLAARWQADTLNLKPNVLSILVGINDTLSGNESPEQYQQVYDKLLADTVTALPNTKIVLGEPFLLPVGNHKAHYTAELAELKKRQEVVATLAQKYHLPLVRYQEAFDEACRKAPPEHWSWDGVHPQYAGHGLMVLEWLKTVKQFWPQG
jgi:lysophospholipase L1-like esterase